MQTTSTPRPTAAGQDGFAKTSPETSSPPSSAGAASAWRQLWKGEASLDVPVFRAGVFLFILIECAALFWVLRRFNIENELFRLLVGVAFMGFAIHHFLPLRFRLPFFLTLSVGLIFYCLGLERAQWNVWNSLQRAGVLFGIGFSLIGICRLPIRYTLRVGLLVLCAIVLAIFRAKLFTSQILDTIWPILGGMFMYRLIIYIYDLEHEKKRSTWTQACSYFFLFPNLWLFLFPAIDYKTFLKEYFNDRPHLIYQRGLHWMMRGVIHLLLWRLVYYQFYIDPSRVDSGPELIQYMLANIALYLRVSGQFHFVIGLMHLFGFNLPETNRRYFLAASFVDYWRRINIYMTNFLMKICYYPLVVRLKKLGSAASIGAAISCCFILTIFLHPYQWFWIRGDFPVRAPDVLFWTLLGLGVVVNSVRNAKPQSDDRAPQSQWKASFLLALRTAGTFAVITFAWSIWSADSMNQWVGLWRFADSSALLWTLATLGLVMLATLILESPLSPWNTKPKLALGKKAAAVFRWPAALRVCAVPALLLVIGSSGLVLERLPAEPRKLAASLFWNTPNKAGEEYLVRGYYEGVMDMNRISPMLQDAMNSQPANWQLLDETAAVFPTNDFRTRDLHPSRELTINGIGFRTNRWGMRDNDYPLDPPNGAIRVAVLGSSVTMGWNVPQSDTFESLTETELAGRHPNRPIELLNFAVNGFSTVSQVEHLTEKVLKFKPHAVLLVSHPEDVVRAYSMVAKTVSGGVKPRYPFLLRILSEAGATATDDRRVLSTKLTPYGVPVVKGSLEAISAICSQNGIRPMFLYLPSVLQRETTALDRELVASAKSAGFEVFPLYDVYAGETDRSKLVVAPWDAHPNAAGHRLIAGQLIRGLMGSETLRDLLGKVRR